MGNSGDRTVLVQGAMVLRFAPEGLWDGAFGFSFTALQEEQMPFWKKDCRLTKFASCAG